MSNESPNFEDHGFSMGDRLLLPLYPEILPESLRKLPDLFKGKAADAAEMFLTAKCDHNGVLACEMAAHLLDEEMTSQDTPYSFEERMAILRNAHELDDWNVKAGRDYADDPVIREKLGFVINLATSYAQSDKNNYWRFMNEAAYCARQLAEIYRERLGAEEAERSQETCVAEGA